MKKKVFLGLFAFLLVFCFIGCDNGTTSTEEEPTGPLIAGKFSSQTGAGDAIFYADYASNSRSISRAVGGMAATEKELSGKIEDGDIVFNLKGVYDTATEKFFLSAGSSFLVYQIAGTLTGGSLSSTEAAVKIKSGDDWQVHTVAVAATEDAAIDSAPSDEQKEGIPSQWFGKWNIQGINGNVIITSFQYIDTSTSNKPNGLIDFYEDIQGQKYRMIFQQVDPSGNVYIWITAEADGENLKVTQYFDSRSEDYAITRDFDISGGGDTQVDILSRAN